MERHDPPSLEAATRSLVDNVTVIKAAARLLEGYWDRLDDDDRNRMLVDITRHAELIQELVDGLVGTMPSELRDVIDLRLDELRRARG